MESTGNHDVGDDALSAVIRLEVDEVSKLSSYGRDSPVIEVGGVPWYAKVCKGVGHDSREGLAMFLFGMTNISTQWSIDVKAQYILFNADINKNVSLEECITFQHNRESYGGYQLDWEDVINPQKGFIKDGKITVEIRFSILRTRGIRTTPAIDFTDPKDPRHDITLIIDGQKVYANKAILAVHSPVFNSMFYGEFVEHGQKEIELKDVDREEFIEMLHMIYPSYKKISDENVRFLLKLGDKFQIKLVLDLAEEYLISSEEQEIATKLLLSDQYRLIHLQDHCIHQLDTQEEVRELRDSPEYRDLSDAIRSSLLEKMFGLMDVN